MIRTVGELIAALQEYPADMIVLTPGLDGYELFHPELDSDTEVYTGPKDAEKLTKVVIIAEGAQPTISVDATPPDGPELDEADAGE